MQHNTSQFEQKEDFNQCPVQNDRETVHSSLSAVGKNNITYSVLTAIKFSDPFVMLPLILL